MSFAVHHGLDYNRKPTGVATNNPPEWWVKLGACLFLVGQFILEGLVFLDQPLDQLGHGHPFKAVQFAPAQQAVDHGLGGIVAHAINPGEPSSPRTTGISLSEVKNGILGI